MFIKHPQNVPATGDSREQQGRARPVSPRLCRGVPQFERLLRTSDRGLDRKLLDLGADIEADGAVIAGGTPLADAVAFGQWKAARRLIERGAQSNLWQSAALGLMDRVTSHFQDASKPRPAEEITKAFWLACHGGQRTAAEYLLDRGADINWIGYDNLTALDAARRSEAMDVAHWLAGRGAKSAK